MFKQFYDPISSDKNSLVCTTWEQHQKPKVEENKLLKGAVHTGLHQGRTTHQELE